LKTQRRKPIEEELNYGTAEAEPSHPEDFPSYACPSLLAWLSQIEKVKGLKGEV
jgi:hypothetical protein